MTPATGRGPANSGLWFLPALAPLPALLLLALIAEVLFLHRLGDPAQMLFDETHYVPAARLLFAGEAYTNVEHPPLGKWLIGLSMALFGDDPAGWRMLSTFAGTATVLASYLITRSLVGDARAALAGGLLTILDQLVFIQARIAMLDVYVAAFLLFALWLLVDGYDKPGGTRLRLIGSGLLFGLAIGCKWSAAPYLPTAALGFLLLRLSKREGWPGISIIEALLWLLALPALVYLATFAPAFFVAQNRLAPGALLSQQLVMYREQTQRLAPHTYQSSWWQWPWIGRTIWYLYAPVDGVWRGVLLAGNPPIMWGGIAAVLACLVEGVRARAPRLLLIAGLFLFSWLMFAVLPKQIAFYYYYYLPAILLSTALAAALQRLRGPMTRWAPPAFMALSAALFVYFYPIISAAPLAGGEAFLHWTWFESWK